MKFVVPAAVVGAVALAAAGCALPAIAAPAPQAHHAAAVVAASRPASHPHVHLPVTAHPVHDAKPSPLPAKHAPTKTKPAPKKPHVKPHPKPIVKPVITSTVVTVHGVAGQVTLTKLKGVSHLALSVAGQAWNGIDLGQNRNQAVYSWVKGRSFDTVHALTTQLDAQFPGASSRLPADLIAASLFL